MQTDAPDTDADLVALVGSRLCHDLISPLGAIGNGVELLTMSGVAMSPELQLIAESVASANARVKFFRIAFGQASADQRLGRPELVTLMKALSQGGRMTYDWQVEGDQPRRAVKLAFLAILCLEPAMPRGGTISVHSDQGHWHVAGTAERTKPDPALWANLDGEASKISPAQVQFALLPREAALQGRALHWEMSDSGVAITF